MDLYETKYFDEWLSYSVKQDLLRELKERWERDTHGNCVFISATERNNVDLLREVIINKVREIYGVRYPYKEIYY